jgi:putative ABC transport system ATP-binding protein
MEQNEAILKIENVHKIYEVGEVRINALRGVTLEVHSGDFVAVMGASGSGKSTLMHILGCLDRPTSGKYYFKGIDTSSMNNVELAKIRRNYIGFVFQAYNLLPRTTAFDNVELPLLYAKRFRASKRKELVLRALESVGLKDRMFNKPNQLSGGQQQRVAIARAIVNNPSVIFADEPTGNLDTHSSMEIMTIFQKLNNEGATIVFVTHEANLADFCKSKVMFRDGKIISIKINDHPKSAQAELDRLPVMDENTEVV